MDSKQANRSIEVASSSELVSFRMNVLSNSDRRLNYPIIVNVNQVFLPGVVGLQNRPAKHERIETENPQK